MKLFDNLKGWTPEKRYRYMILFLVSFAGDGWSYESTVMASIIQLPPYIQHLGYGEGIPDNINQLIGPIYSLGQAVGGFLAAFVLDTCGRRINLWAGFVALVTSVTLLMLSSNLAMVLVARVIQGASIGFLLLGYQIYAVEIAAKEDRGFVSSFTLMTGNFFGLLAAGIIYGISYTTDNAGWRSALGVTYIPATALACVLPFAPESPRYLFEKGRTKECRSVLRRLHGGRVDEGVEILSEAAEIEYVAIQAAITWDQEHGQDKWSALWNSKAARYRSFVALTSQSWWAWNGGSIFTYYFTIVYSSAGITRTQDQSLIAAIQKCYVACLNLIIQGSITIAVFDKGQENLAAGGAFITFYLLQWLLWVTFYSPVVNMLPAEIYSAGLRARGYAAANVVSMGMGFATQYSALPMYRSLGGRVWFLFSGIMALASMTIYFTYPETKGITLEQVETVFGTGAGQRVKIALGRRGSAASASQTIVKDDAPSDSSAVDKVKAQIGSQKAEVVTLS